MSLYSNRNGAKAVFHEVHVPYSNCDSTEVERRGPRPTLYCTLFDRLCPDEETIYLALRNVQSVGVLGRRRFKKTRLRIEKIEAVVTEAQDQPNCRGQEAMDERKIRLDIGNVTEGLSRKEQETDDQQEMELKQIAEERRKLDERETNVQKDQEEDKREYRKSVELDVIKSLDGVRKLLEGRTFFV
ncbi:hypothetical protein IWW34DRAFT_885093 [Fusarium oxysporum f. sp. albedinis]|nr:hypothetical protein IWW34DRAFT_885093 [Fusarium oxysporum f. sp. albedinis]